MKVSVDGLLKALVDLMCCFVPKTEWRKTLRYRMVGIKKERNELLDAGFKIDGEIITTPQGVKIDISRTADHPLYMVKVVFIRSEYSLNIRRDSIVIDIGMNRAVASLLFATNDNIKRIYAYEPFRPTFEVAQKNLQLNPQFSGKIKAFNFGLGASDKTLELPYMEDSTGGMSTTHDVCQNVNNATTEKVTVKDAAKEIRSILQENKEEHIIVKCDCEGAEFEIFERLRDEDLINKLDVVIMEYHFEKPDPLINMLTQNAFAVQTKIGSRRSKTGYIYAVRMPEK